MDDVLDHSATPPLSLRNRICPTRRAILDTLWIRHVRNNRKIKNRNKQQPWVLFTLGVSIPRWHWPMRYFPPNSICWFNLGECNSHTCSFIHFNEVRHWILLDGEWMKSRHLNIIWDVLEDVLEDVPVAHGRSCCVPYPRHHPKRKEKLLWRDYTIQIQVHPFSSHTPPCHLTPQGPAQQPHPSQLCSWTSKGVGVDFPTFLGIWSAMAGWIPTPSAGNQRPSLCKAFHKIGLASSETDHSQNPN